MRNLFISLTLFISFNTFGQKEIPADSLYKYSYPIMGIFPSISAGTCFFIKNNNSLYMVTAKHVILGCGNLPGEIPPKNYPDVLLVGQYKNFDFCFTIDNKEYKKNNTCGGIDLFVKKIDKKYFPYYNSIEQFIIPPLNKWSSMEAFGYPESIINNIDSSVRIPEKSIHATFPAMSFDFLPYRDSTDKIDSNFYQVNFPMNVGVTYGFSGCPLFLQDNVTKKWRVIGLLAGGTDPFGDSRRLMYYVDIKYVLREISKL